ASRTTLVLLLAHPVSECNEHVAAMAKPADLGHLCHRDLPDRVACLLVHGLDPGFRNAAGSCAFTRQASRIRPGCPGVARRSAAMVPLRDCLSADGRARDATSDFGAHRRVARLLVR